MAGLLVAGQVVATLYHPHYSLLVRIAALLTGDTTAAERMVEDAFVSVQHARRHLRDQDDALSYLRRFVVSSARSQRAASPGHDGSDGVFRQRVMG